MTPAIEVDHVSRSFGRTLALDDVSLSVDAGRIHALLGPNGAGKTTLLRILAGLVAPERGEVRLSGKSIEQMGYREHRRLFSIVPSGERTMYLRLSGLENLLFFGRLYGLSRADARARAEECLSLVGLAHAADQRTGTYSQGMQKRLSIARALLIEPRLMLVDEATQSLDPEGSRTTRRLVSEVAARGTAVLWTTQRVDEIRGFADGVTVLRQGSVGFEGTVAELVSVVATRKYLVHLNGAPGLQAELPPSIGSLEAVAVGGHYRMWLRDGISLGSAVIALADRGVDVLACREEVSDVEEAFVLLTEDR